MIDLSEAFTVVEHQAITQGSPEWHDVRRGLVTASSAGRLVTSSHIAAVDLPCSDCGAKVSEPCRSKVNRTPIKTVHSERTAAAAEDGRQVLAVADNDQSRSLTALLVAERITGYTDPTYIGADMWRGIDDEPFAREVYAEHYAPVREVGFMTREGAGYRIGYSPDGLVGDDGTIEIKSRRQKKHLTTILADEVPAENMAQIQFGLFVSGRAWCDYISFASGMPLWRKRIEPDKAWLDVLEDAVGAFELRAKAMTDDYHARVAGLPPTERRVEVEMF